MQKRTITHVVLSTIQTGVLAAIFVLENSFALKALPFVLFIFLGLTIFAIASVVIDLESISEEDRALLNLDHFNAARLVKNCKWFNRFDAIVNLGLGVCFAGSGHYLIASLLVANEIFTSALRVVVVDKAKKIEQGMG